MSLLMGLVSSRFASDDFSVNDISNYTAYAATVGTWAIASGQLKNTDGVQSIITRNSISFASGKITATIVTAPDGGLAIRLLDNSNYYLLACRDSTGISAGNNLQIYKKIGGTYTSLVGPSAISFTTGTPHTISFEIVGNTLNGYFDGSLIVTATDSTITTAGLCGMRSGTGGSAVYDSFTWPI